MARIRSIKPEILADEKTGTLRPEVFKLFVGLMLQADDYGNLRCHPRLIWGAVFWGNESIGVAQVEGMLAELATADLIRFYEADGQRYAHIKGWEKHQRVDKPGRPAVPSPSSGGSLSAERPEKVRESAGKSRDVLAPDLDQDQDLDLEEEKEEEKDEEDSNPSGYSGEPKTAAPVDGSALVPAEQGEIIDAEWDDSADPVAFELPVVGRGAPVAIRESQVAKYVELYPSADVRLELGRVVDWLERNPDRRSKGSRGTLRRVASWLTSAHEKAARGQRVQVGAPPGVSAREARGFQAAQVWKQLRTARGGA
jgi:hypothetical protein